jgi:hypothetical protein
VKVPGFGVVCSADGTTLDAFDKDGRSGLSVSADPDAGLGIAMFGRDGKPIEGASPSSQGEPDYVPTFDAVRPPPPLAESPAAVRSTLKEWSEAFDAADKAAKLAAALMRLGGGPRDASFLYALKSRDKALKACLVLKQRYEAAVREGR